MFFICRYDLKGHATTENELRYGIVQIFYFRTIFCF